MSNDHFNSKVHLGEPWPNHWLQFERDMQAVGLNVHECAGPNGWGGPAVTVARERLTEITRATLVKLDSHDVDGETTMAYPAEIDQETGETFQEILASLHAARSG